MGNARADEGRVEGTIPPGLGSTRITGDALLDQVEWLSAPLWKGRATGTTECDSLVRVLADRLRTAGWKPAVADSSYFSFFPLTTGVRVEGEIGLRDNDHGYTFGADYTPIACSGKGHALAEVVFAGYGLSAQERGYDDYEAITVTGKIVLAFLGEPGQSSGRGLLGAGASPYASLFRKVETARLHGAAAIVLTPPSSMETPADSAWRIPADVAAIDAGLPALMITKRVAASLAQGTDLAKLEHEIDAGLKPQSRELVGRRAEVLSSLHREEGVGRSAVAMLPASGSSDAGAGALLLLATVSGGGMGPDGGHKKLQPSANDDASAVAACLEIAKVLPMVPRDRKVYLALISGRELGSAGARALRDKLPDVSTVVFLHALGRDGRTRIESESPALLERASRANDTLPTPVVLDAATALSSWAEVVPFLGREVEVLAIIGPGAAGDGGSADTAASLSREAFTDRVRFAFGVAQTLARSE